MDVVPADDHRYKFADNKWYVKYNTKYCNNKRFLYESCTSFHNIGGCCFGELITTGTFILFS